MSESDATASDSAEIKVQGDDGVEVAEEAGAAPGETDTYSSCGVCGMRFPTRRGASQHERQVHQEWFHGVRLHLVSKSGWFEDEMVLVAREENRLVAVGRQFCSNMAANIRVNADLCKAFPSRSADAIKGLRRQAKYRELRDRLSLGGPPAEDPIDYERPWQARSGMVAGGLPPPPTRPT